MILSQNQMMKRNPALESLRWEEHSEFETSLDDTVRQKERRERSESGRLSNFHACTVARVCTHTKKISGT